MRWWCEYKENISTGQKKKHASSIIVCLLGRKIKCMFSKCTTRQKRHSVWNEKDRAMPSRGHKKEQLRKEMRKNSEDILFLSWGSFFFGWTQESQALQREEKEGGSNTWQDLLFTPFLPLRSFLYCSLSLVIRPGSTSQASMGPCSSFSTQGEQNQTETLLRNCPVWGPRGLYYEASSSQTHDIFYLVSVSRNQQSHSRWG